MDRLSEAIYAAQNAAVEQHAANCGPFYASALEGYGDLTREYINLQNSVKTIKKCLADVVEYVSAQDPQELHKALILMEGKVNIAAYDAVRMCGAVKVMEETIRHQTGGDLLDALMEDDDAD